MEDATPCDIFSQQLIATGIFFQQIIFFQNHLLKQPILSSASLKENRISVKRYL